MFDPERAGEQTVTPLDPDPADDQITDPTPDRGRPNDPRDLWTRASTRRRAVVATVTVLSVTLVAGLLAWNGGAPSNGAIAAASQPTATSSARGSSGPGGSNGPGPSAGTIPGSTFEPLTGTSTEPVALLTARGAIGAIVPIDAGFRLEATDATPASTLARRLTVRPAVAFTVTKEAGDRAVVLEPVKPLDPGSVYRFALSGAGGQLLDTWAFQAKQPLRIVGTLPGHESAEVPLDTGIEVTFDQDGVTGAAAHFTIEPATAGRFEEHGRTLAFVPNRPLTASTVYSVTVTRGIKVPATGEATVVDTRFQFETAAKGRSSDPRTFIFPDEVTESPTTERPTIGLWSYGGGAQKPPATTRIAVYRLPDLAAAIAAYRTLRARPDWTRWSGTGLVDVARLRRILTADLPLNSFRNAFWVRLPERLAAGWYLVQQSGGTKPIQLVLQVTDVAGYLAVSDTKTVVWANDLATRKPIAGATVASNGVRFARTDDRGLAVGTTPKTLLPSTGDSCSRPCDPVVVVETPGGRRIFLPLSSGYDKLEYSGNRYWWSEADDRTWSLLHTDRGRYRPGDTVNLWGFARDRDNGSVPAEITLRIQRADGEGPSIRTLTRRPDGSGVFDGNLSLGGLPDGYYTITMAVGSRVIRSTMIGVGPIAKPAYQLDITTGRHVYIVGDQVRVTVGAHFFEGTPVPGVDLRFDGFAEGSATTDALGSAVWRTVAAIDPDEQGPSWSSIQATPARAEEAEIRAATRHVLIFPSSRTVDATGRIAGGRVIASGSVHVVAVDRLEAALAGGEFDWNLDARGAAVRGATVTVRFTELVPRRVQDGTQYDFIEKRVVPRYRYDVGEIDAGTVRVRTAADGSWTASVPAANADHTYQIAASVGDPDGHVARTSTSASRARQNPYEDNDYPTLDLSSPAPDERTEFGIGERIDVRMTDPGTAQTATDGTRYLFFTAQRGIRDTTIQTSRRHQMAFPAWGAPNLSIGAVRFTGTGYVGTAWFTATFRVADRRLDVELTTDAPRYAPGETVTVSVRTRSGGGPGLRDGRPPGGRREAVRHRCGRRREPARRAVRRDCGRGDRHVSLSSLPAGPERRRRHDRRRR